MRCPNCKSYVEKEDLFCSVCGHPISPEEMKKSSKRNLIIIIAVCVAAFIAIACVGVLFFLNSGEKSSDGSADENNIRQESDEASSKEEDKEEAIAQEGDISASGQENDSNVGVNETETVNSGYIIADSDSRYLTDSDTAGLTLQQINYAKNEIYARHGRRFNSQELQNYFDSQSWYTGQYTPEDFDSNYSESVLNDYEKKNAEFLKSKELELSPNGYQPQ